MEIMQTVMQRRVGSDADMEEVEPEMLDPMVPPPPRSLAETGLSDEFVSGLLLKALYTRGSAMGFDLVDMLALPMEASDDAIVQLQEQRLVELHEALGPRRGEYVFKLTSAGRARAVEELELCRYVGPAPVPFDEWMRWVERQTIASAQVTRDAVCTAMDGVVLPEETLDRLGPAINSGRSLFLYGGPGDGKTLVAERISRVFGDRYFVPFAVLVDGAVMVLHDPAVHGPSPDEAGPAGVRSAADDAVLREIVRPNIEYDRRFAKTRRPVVVTGGELQLDQLDLQWDAVGRMYQAPPQLKAAGGVLVIDDLGRQRVPVRDLLNRWIVPLEQRHDHLKLQSGRTLVVPFDCFVIFSTNIEPRALADEAFLRRIHYKIEVVSPDREEFARIFEQCCTDRDIAYHDAALDFLFEEVYADGSGIVPRRCHPRDILDQLTDLAAYCDEPPYLSPKALSQACRSYFVAPATPPDGDES